MPAFLPLCLPPLNPTLCPPDASAFRPKAKTVGVYESSLAAGRPVLSGPLSVEAVAHEVLAWAVALPVYAGELVGLVHTLLERALERCKTVLTEVGPLLQGRMKGREAVRE